MSDLSPSLALGCAGDGYAAIEGPPSIQPHGVLLVLDEQDLAILQASTNAAPLLGLEEGSVLGRGIEDLLGAEQARSLAEGLQNPSLEKSPIYLRTVTVCADGQRRAFYAIAHRNDGALILELESAAAASDVSFTNLYPIVRTFLARVKQAETPAALCRVVAAEVRRAVSFDRAIVWRFDANGGGTVVAADQDGAPRGHAAERLPPAVVPSQARTPHGPAWQQLIVACAEPAVPIEPAVHPRTGRPLDLTYAALGIASAAQCDSLRQLGVAASMVLAVLRDGEPWGVIVCHHPTRRFVPFEVRTACELLSEIFALELSAKERRGEYEYRIQLKQRLTALLARLARADDFFAGFAANAGDLAGYLGARGVAVVVGDRALRFGDAPAEDAVHQLCAWLGRTEDDIYTANDLATEWPHARDGAGGAGRLLAASISRVHRSYVLWFRPRDTADRAGGPWQAAEIDAAADLRSAIINVVLRQAEERAELTAELQRSNQELEAFSYSVSHDLRAPFRHITGYAELLRESDGAYLGADGQRYLATIIDSARYAGKLVDSLLHFAQLGRVALDETAVDTGRLVREVIAELEAGITGRRIHWQVGTLPEVQADLLLLRLVFQNLLGNAVKFTRHRPETVIEVGARPEEAETVFFVCDNGAGFDMRYADKLFGVFQRLHRAEDFEGTGIGLAHVRRIIARHGGRTWAEGALDTGATFYFTLPREDASGG